MCNALDVVAEKLYARNTAAVVIEDHGDVTATGYRFEEAQDGDHRRGRKWGPTRVRGIGRR
jgi:hypothetical protein